MRECTAIGPPSSPNVHRKLTLANCLRADSSWDYRGFAPTIPRLLSALKSASAISASWLLMPIRTDSSISSTCPIVRRASFASPSRRLSACPPSGRSDERAPTALAVN
jgi:hypothetical protein